MIYKNKRFIAAVIAAVTIVSAFSATFAVNAVENQKIGDVNGDSRININDATTIQKVIAKLIEAPENYNEIADVNLDNEVNIKDVTVIQKYLAKIYNELPYKTDETEPATVNPTSAQETTEPKASEQPTDPESTTAPDGTQPTTVQPATTQPITTEPSTQPETDEEGWGHKIYQP